MAEKNVLYAREKFVCVFDRYSSKQNKNKAGKLFQEQQDKAFKDLPTLTLAIINKANRQDRETWSFDSELP